MGGGPGPKRTGAICRKVLTALVYPYCKATLRSMALKAVLSDELGNSVNCYRSKRASSAFSWTREQPSHTIHPQECHFCGLVCNFHTMFVIIRHARWKIGATLQIVVFVVHVDKHRSLTHRGYFVACFRALLPKFHVGNIFLLFAEVSFFKATWVASSSYLIAFRSP